MLKQLVYALFVRDFLVVETLEKFELGQPDRLLLSRLRTLPYVHRLLAALEPRRYLVLMGSVL